MVYPVICQCCGKRIGFTAKFPNTDIICSDCYYKNDDWFEEDEKNNIVW